MSIVPQSLVTVEQAKLNDMELHHPERSEIELPAVLHALSDPHRLEIVRRLAQDSEPRPCGSLDFGVTKSTMTHHFRTLREAGVIRQERQGTTKLTALRREDLDTRFPGLLDAVLSSKPVPA
jgi:DNA-binding transcriptional ArsR family regulator